MVSRPEVFLQYHALHAFVEHAIDKLNAAPESRRLVWQSFQTKQPVESMQSAYATNDQSNEVSALCCTPRAYSFKLRREHGWLAIGHEYESLPLASTTLDSAALTSYCSAASTGSSLHSQHLRTVSHTLMRACSYVHVQRTDQVGCIPRFSYSRALRADRYPPL